MTRTSKRILIECLEGLKKIRRQKQAIREHYSKRFFNESSRSNQRLVKRHLESCYQEDCNDYLDCCKDILANCCNLPELQCCFDDICDEDGCVFDDCEEEDFDCCLNNAIQKLTWLIIPVRVRC